MIDSDGTEASSDDENNRFCGIESAELQAFPRIAGQQFLADWRSGQNGFVFRETFDGFREITADLCSGRNTQLICQARRHIRFMDERRDFTCFGGKDNRYRNEAAFGEDNVWFQLFEQFFCFKIAFYDAEWIGKVFRIEVAAQLSG